MSENILDKILKTKRKEVADLHKSVDLATLMAQEEAAPPVRDFFGALTKPPSRGVNLIAEIKKASPSKGLIREDFDPANLAKIYAAAGADALSVLTDEQYFQGHLDYLRQVREAVDLPIIRKDFIIDPWQVFQARAAGADAILLIAAALQADELVELMELADQLGMTVLLEIHNAAELAKIRGAKKFPPKNVNWLMGINNRDLTTFEVDLDTTVNLIPAITEDVPIISESGIATQYDVEHLASAGVSGILVGETFMRQENVAQAVEKLLGPLPE